MMKREQDYLLNLNRKLLEETGKHVDRQGAILERIKKLSRDLRRSVNRDMPRK